MPPLTQDEIESFLNQPLIAKLCSFNEDGTIHASLVYYKHENGLIWMAIQDISHKVRNIKRNNKVTVLIDSQEPPFKCVLIYGKAELDYEDVNQKRIIILDKYMPRDKAQELTQDLAHVWKPVIICVFPERIILFDYAKEPPPGAP